MTNYDLTIGIEMFKESFGREPRPTELLKVAEIQRSTFAFAPVDQLETMWQTHVADKQPIDWDEFSMVGCLDGAP